MLFPLLVRPISTCWTWFELTCEALHVSHQEPPAHQYKCKALTHWDGLASQTRSYHVGRVVIGHLITSHAVCGLVMARWLEHCNAAILGLDETLASLCRPSVRSLQVCIRS